VSHIPVDPEATLKSFDVDNAGSKREDATRGKRDRRSHMDRLWGVIYALSLLLIVIGALTVYNLRLVQDAKDAADNSAAQTLLNRETGYKNRAMSCQVLIILNSEMPDACNEPEVKQYYSDVSSLSQGTKAVQNQTRIICDLFNQLTGRNPPECTLAATGQESP
jgi:hypothetical protein